MPRIRCLYTDCNFLDNTYCTAISVEIDPDMGCATYTPLGETDALSNAWGDDDDDFDDWDTEDLDLDDDEDDEEDEDFDDEEDDW
jgi:hypothetical protein